MGVGGAVRFRPIQRAGGGGGGGAVRVRAKHKFLDKRGGCKPQNPLKLRAKKRNLDKRGGLQPPPPPPCIQRTKVGLSIKIKKSRADYSILIRGIFIY